MLWEVIELSGRKFRGNDVLMPATNPLGYVAMQKVKFLE
jgi:hypothetical protein